MHRKYELFTALLIQLTLQIISGMKENNIRDLSVVSSRSAFRCVTYENSPDYKWCRNINVINTGYYWSNDETSEYWGGNKDYVWSNNQKFKDNSIRLLCPLDPRRCNTQTYTEYLVL